MSSLERCFCNHLVVCCRLCLSFLITSAELGTTGRDGVQSWHQTLASPRHQALSVLGVQTLILLGLFFPKIDSTQVSTAQGFCRVLAPMNKEMWNLRKATRNVFVCITESINIAKDFCCLPCPVGSPFLKPSNLAEGWPGSSKVVTRTRTLGSQCPGPRAF